MFLYPKLRFYFQSLFLFAFCFFFFTCEKKAPVELVETVPKLLFHTTPNLIKQNSTSPVSFMVQVEDAQGIDNILQVKLSIANGTILLDAEMFDTGLDGDIIKQDGVYTHQLIPKTSPLSPGKYSVNFQALDRDGNESAVISDSVVVEAGGDGFAPKILSVEFPEAFVIDSDTIVTLVVKAEDEDGDLDGVELRFYTSASRQPILTDSLRSTVEDGLFEKDINTSIFTLIESDYFFRVQAFDLAGNSSLPVTKINHVKRVDRNDPPQVLSVSAPDTVSKSGQTNFLVTVEITDPQGLSDIARVILNSFRPDGSAAGENPFFLRDDGISGDITADDGVYSLRVGFDQSNITGTYRFEIHAEDKAGASSNIVIHLITLTE